MNILSIKKKTSKNIILSLIFITSSIFVLSISYFIHPVDAYFARSDGIVGYVPLTKSGDLAHFMNSASQWYYDSGDGVEYQLITNDYNHKGYTSMASSDPDLYWKDAGIAFYVIDFKRDTH